MSHKSITVLIELISALLVFLFVYTALSKAMDFHRFSVVLTTSPLIGNNAEFIAPVIISVEFIAALLLLIAPLRRSGFYLSFLLMVAFTSYIGYMVSTHSTLPCSCGGVLQEMTWKQHFWFNLFFLGLSFAGLMLVIRTEKQKHLSENKPVLPT